MAVENEHQKVARQREAVLDNVEDEARREKLIDNITRQLAGMRNA